MAEIDTSFLDFLSKEELVFIKSYIEKLLHKSDNAGKNPFRRDICTCPECGKHNIVKNGTRNGIQRYLCKDCRHSFSDHTGTMMDHSRISEDRMKTFIDAEIRGDSLQEISYETGMSVTSCFNNRQKLYKMAGIKVNQQQLSGQIEMDATYGKINLSGTRPENMPRISKKRGSHAPVVGERKSLKGPSHHKICIVTAIDESDNIVYKVTGLGQESISKYEKIRDCLSDVTMIISDKSHSIQNFARTHNMKSDAIPVKPNEKHYTTPLGNSLGDVNQLHQELKELVRVRHGISSRHLQGYLDWIAYTKKLGYTLERGDQAAQVIRDMRETESILHTKDISQQIQPISLYQAYSEYHYGIYASDQSEQ